MKKLKAVEGAAVSESEYEQLKALQEGASLREDILKELKGSAMSENEIKKFKNLMPKKAKGGEVVMGKGADYIKDLL
jgi:hypothetical protein